MERKIIKDGTQMSNDIKEFSQAIIAAAKKFRFDHEIRGYDTTEVNRFLGWLIEAAEYYGKSSMAMGEPLVKEARNSNETISEDYADLADETVNTIQRSLFTQGFKGYDTAKVDEFLEEIILSIAQSVERGGKPMAGRYIRNQQFKTGFRGYEAKEVDAFLEDIANAVDRLGRIREGNF